MEKNLNKFIVITALVLLLTSCSLNGYFILHNSSLDRVTLHLTSEAYVQKEYAIDAGKTGKLRFNFNIDNEVSVTAGEKQWCYQLKKLPTEWITPSVSGPKIFANLTEDGQIYIYSKESNEVSFHQAQAPIQPEGYPLKPIKCL